VLIPLCCTSGFVTTERLKLPRRTWKKSQRNSTARCRRSTPRIAYVPKVISSDRRQALAVIIPGSELRPHFAGPAYVRRGPESVDASEEQFAELIAQRNSKADFLLRWKGKNVTVFTQMGDDELAWPNDTRLVDCNQFYVNLQRYFHEPPLSFPLSRVEINFYGCLRTATGRGRSSGSFAIPRRTFSVPRPTAHL
jgi:hypothetical protein